MAQNKNIILVGPMGAGKTTIGRNLARKLSLEFYDSDHEIEQRTGADIPWIFEIEGEAGFRKRESTIIEELTKLQNIVLATGGGAIINQENRQHMQQSGIVFYLNSGAEKLLKRTQTDKRRPLLQTQDRLARIKQIIAERDPLYREIADEIIQTDKMSVSHIVKFIIKRISRT
ncbi:MAG: shikimate kinase AroK [Pseudomonadota bacterium]